MTREEDLRKDQELLGPCCRIFLCCDPPAAVAALAAHEGIGEDAAAKIHAGYQIIPRSLEPGPEPVSEEHIRSAQQRLERLLRRNQTELKSILLDMGYAEKGA